MAKKISSQKYQGVYYSESKIVKYQGKPDKIYWIKWYDGKPRWSRIGSASHGIKEEYANRRRIDIINKLNLGENPDLLTKKKGATVDAIVAAYMEWRKAEGKHTTADQNRYDKHIYPVIGILSVSAITPERLDALKTVLLGKMSNATAKKTFALMRAAVNLAIKRKRYAGVNPFSAQADFAMPKEDNQRERFFTPEEAAVLLDELEKRSTQLYHMAFVALHTGMRATEIFSIKGSDINEKDSLAIITAKGGERETVFLPPDALAVLVSYRTSQDALLFQKRGGGRIVNISDSFNRAVDALGLNETNDPRLQVTFHTLRHTFASWLAQSGKVTLIELQRLMRHKRIEMTLRYAHLIPDQRQVKAGFKLAHPRQQAKL